MERWWRTTIVFLPVPKRRGCLLGHSTITKLWWCESRFTPVIRVSLSMQQQGRHHTVDPPVQWESGPEKDNQSISPVGPVFQHPPWDITPPLLSRHDTGMECPPLGVTLDHEACVQTSTLWNSAWLAGFLDGEGCFFTSPRVSPSTSRCRLHASFSITQKGGTCALDAPGCSPEWGITCQDWIRARHVDL